MNKALLVGRITRDPELRYTGSNRPVTQLTVAINRTFTNQNGEREADFINVVVWDKQAESICKYLSKGSQIAVEGRIQTRNYDDKDGKKVYVTEVVSNNVQFLDSKGSNSSQNNYSGANPFDVDTQQQPKTEQTVSVEKDPFESFGETIEINDNELPF